MSDNPNRKVEWSFDFGKLNDRISRSWTEADEIKHSQFNEALGAAERAVIHIDLGLGPSEIRALDNTAGVSPHLLTADLHHFGDVQFDVQGAAEKQVRLGQREGQALDVIGGLKALFSKLTNSKAHPDLRWDIGLSTVLPLRLEIEGGVGPAKIDLSELQLHSLSVEGSVGDTEVILPATGQAYPIELEGGVGRMRVTVQRNAQINMNMDGGIGQVILLIQPQVRANLHIEGSVGSIELELPPHANVRLAGQGGLGAIHPLARMSTQGKEGDYTVWETTEVSDNGTDITITYEGGVGVLILRESSVV
jgi:hypothetical protein